MLATFGSGDVFLSLLEFFFLIVFFWLLITVFSDLFRDHELSGWAKAAWVLFVVIIPFLGILVYLIARGSGMQKRAIAAQKEAQDHFKEYVRETAASSGGATSSADELSKLSGLHDAGKITDEEFAALKAKDLS